MSRLLLATDLQNIFYGVRDLYGPEARIDFKRLREDAVAGRKFTSVRCVAYLTSYRDDVSALKHVLEKLHYEVKVRYVTGHHGRLADTDIDSMLIVDVLSANLSTGDVAVIASGDSDMIPLYHALKSQGCRVEVLAVPGCLSRDVKAVVHEVRYLSEGILLPRQVVVAG